MTAQWTGHRQRQWTRSKLASIAGRCELATRTAAEASLECLSVSAAGSLVNQRLIRPLVSPVECAQPSKGSLCKSTLIRRQWPQRALVTAFSVIVCLRKRVRYCPLVETQSTSQPVFQLEPSVRSISGGQSVSRAVHA